MMQEQPLSLYLALEEGKHADLEVIARAALAFAAAAREIAYILDPGAEVRLDLQSGSEGSLSLNSLIQFVKGDTASRKKTLAIVALTIVAWLANDVRSYGVSEFLDWLRSETPEHSLGIDEQQEVEEAVIRALRKGIAEKQVQQIFKELERDSAIVGVGATTQAGERPHSVVPRERFAERAGHQSVLIEDSRTRRTTSVEQVTLISPVLVASKRRWKFKLAGFEFGAAIKDEAFLARFFKGGLDIPMAEGIELTVVLEIKEEQHDGVWEIKERNVLRVMHVDPGSHGTQIELFPPPDQRD